MALGDVVKVEFLFQGPNGREVVNVMHYQQQSDPLLDFDLTGLSSFASDVANIQGNLLSVMSTYLVGVSTRVTIITGTAAGLQADDLSFAGNAGATLAGDGPVERCSVMSFRTIKIGRANRGRLYVAAPGAGVFTKDGALVGGNADAARYTSLKSHLLQNRQGPATVCMFPCIWHKSSVLPRQIVLICTQSTKAGTQRRRVLA